ncbi:MAG: hypothetical protein JXB30_16185 [Anaerolineae bacterium]|nr:hypothetical protein [Anaerolineae bacterium]
MSHLDKPQITDTRWNNLYTVGAVASLLQLVVIAAYTIVVAVLGPRITSAEEFFAVQQSSRLASLVRMDLPLLILIGLYLGNFPALFLALWRVKPIPTLFATLFTVIAVALSFASESTFALLHLGDLYAAAGSEAQRAQFLAAGDAVIAAGWWNSSGSYVTGILLQGSGVIISLVMLRSKDFSKVTAISGLLGNAFDLAQHLIHPFVTAVPAFFSILMMFYLIWYPMLAWDLFRLGKAQLKVEKEVVP